MLAKPFKKLIVGEKVEDLLQARADALLLPAAGFLYYRDTFHIQPGPCNHLATQFVISLINFLERHDKIIMPSSESKERLIKIMQIETIGTGSTRMAELSGIAEKITNNSDTNDNAASAWNSRSILAHDPLFYALEMEKLAPGLDMERHNKANTWSHHSELSTLSSRREWKRRSWFYLAMLLDQVCEHSCC